MAMSKQDRDTLDAGAELVPVHINRVGKLDAFTLAGKQVKAGAMVEICLSSDPELDEDGEVFSFSHVWILIRVEYDFRGLPIAFWPLPYAGDLMSSRIPAGARLRWPAKPQPRKFTDLPWVESVKIAGRGE